MTKAVAEAALSRRDSMRGPVFIISVAAWAAWGLCVFPTCLAQEEPSGTEPVPCCDADQENPEVAEAIDQFKVLQFDKALELLKTSYWRQALKRRIFAGLAGVAEARAGLAGEDKTAAKKQWAIAPETP